MLFGKSKAHPIHFENMCGSPKRVFPGVTFREKQQMWPFWSNFRTPSIAMATQIEGF